MTPIWIYDRNEQLQLVLSEEGIPYREAWFIEQLNGEIALEFEVPADNPDVALIEPDGRAVIRDQDGNLVEFIIRQPEDDDSLSGTFKRVYADGGDYELIDEWVTGYTASNVTLETALAAVLQGTRWSVGEVGDFGTNSVNLEDVSVKNAVYQLTELYGGERRYRVEADGNTITKRYIDILPQRGVNIGKRFEMGKDIVSARRHVDTTGIKTALYGRGKSGENDAPRLTFADVEWSKANGDPVDKPLGQTWVGDPEALQQWGYDQGTRHRFGMYDGQEEDAGELLLNTWKSLQEQKNARYTYEIEVTLIEQLTGYEHERVRLGDTVYVIDRRVNPAIEVEASVIEYRQNLNDITQSEVTLGNFRRQFESERRIANLEKTVHRKQGNWDEKETPAGAQSKADAALAAARAEIEAAEQRIADAEQAISDAETEIANAQAIIDSVTEERDGITVLKGTLVTNRIIAENATLTGTLTSQNATIIDLITQNLTAIGGTFENVTITGLLTSVDGTFVGDIVTGKDAYIGNNLYLGSQSSYTLKSINFNNQSYIQGDIGLSLVGSRIAMSAFTDMEFDTGLLAAYANVIEMQGFLSITNTGSETGYCGLGGITLNSISSQAQVLTGVNFRVKKTYTPASINLNPIAENATPNITNITNDGFTIYLNRIDDNFRYWRGRYTA